MEKAKNGNFLCYENWSAKENNKCKLQKNKIILYNILFIIYSGFPKTIKTD